MSQIKLTKELESIFGDKKMNKDLHAIFLTLFYALPMASIPVAIGIAVMAVYVMCALAIRLYNDVLIYLPPVEVM
jgi:hypothetical protein